MTALEQKIRDAAKKEGIDLIGFAPKERFEGVDAVHNPFSIFPEGKTVIMIGRRICRGSLRGVEEGTNFGDYSLLLFLQIRNRRIRCCRRESFPLALDGIPQLSDRQSFYLSAIVPVAYPMNSSPSRRPLYQI